MPKIDIVDKSDNEVSMQDIVSPKKVEEKNTKKLPSDKKKTMLIVGVVVLFLALSGAAGYFYYKYQKVSSDPAQSLADKNASETKQVLDALNLILFTEGDKVPTVARVEQTEPLQKSNPDFYKNVQVGDYIILFPNRAVIFRKSENRIINVAPIVNASELQNKSSDANSQTPAAQ